jgi:mannose-6-phosphate isomerase class I
MARETLGSFIKENNPEQFVNVLKVGKGQAIDLSACGIHHSWEENKRLAPLGNVVYEVQKNVYDPVSTIRSFDKGKIKDDGSIRPLQIVDYFKYIDRSLEANDPENLMVKTDIRHKTEAVTVKQVFTNDNYLMDEMILTGNHREQTENCYHHLFSLTGGFDLVTSDTTLTVTEGYSVFMPAIIGQYQLRPHSAKSVIFKTYL